MAAVNLVNVNFSTDLLCDGNGYLVSVFIWRLRYPYDPNAVSASVRPDITATVDWAWNTKLLTSVSVLFQIVDFGPKTGDRGVSLFSS